MMRGARLKRLGILAFVVFDLAVMGLLAVTWVTSDQEAKPAISAIEQKAFAQWSANPPWGAENVSHVQPIYPIAAAAPLSVGAPAPEFSLPRLDDDTTVQLTALHRSKPVVLIFASFT